MSKELNPHPLFWLALTILAAWLLSGCGTVWDDQVPVTKDNAPTLKP